MFDNYRHFYYHKSRLLRRLLIATVSKKVRAAEQCFTSDAHTLTIQFLIGMVRCVCVCIRLARRDGERLDCC